MAEICVGDRVILRQSDYMNEMCQVLKVIKNGFVGMFKV
jgi:hypothetical protein